MQDDRCVGLDLDGVVVDFNHSANAWLAHESGEPPVAPTNWHWYKSYTDGEELFKSLFDPKRNAAFWMGLRPVRGSVKAVKFLWTRHPLMFITHRHEELSGLTQHWLDERGLGDIPVHYMRNAKGKADKTELPVDIHIDDKASTVMRFLDQARPAILFRQPWNHEWWGKLPSVLNWTDLLLRLEWGEGTLIEGGAA